MARIFIDNVQRVNDILLLINVYGWRSLSSITSIWDRYHTNKFISSLGNAHAIGWFQWTFSQETENCHRNVSHNVESIVSYFTSYFKVHISAVDTGYPPRSSTNNARIQVLVTRNRQAPVFPNSEYGAAIEETTSVGASVIDMTARDNDEPVSGSLRISLMKFLTTLIIDRFSEEPPITWFSGLRFKNLSNVKGSYWKPTNESCHANFVVTGGTTGCHNVKLFALQPVMIQLASWQRQVFTAYINACECIVCVYIYIYVENKE